jgi:hypothetical protein
MEKVTAADIMNNEDEGMDRSNETEEDADMHQQEK